MSANVSDKKSRVAKMRVWTVTFSSIRLTVLQKSPTKACRLEHNCSCTACREACEKRSHQIHPPMCRMTIIVDLFKTQVETQTQDCATKKVTSWEASRWVGNCFHQETIMIKKQVNDILALERSSFLTRTRT